MAAPTKPFVPIADEQVDANSPVDELLMTSIRDSLVHLEEWLGDDFVAAKDHDHDDVNSKSVVLGPGVVTQDKMAAAAVGQAELKTATGEVSTSTTANITLPGGEYGFYPQIKSTGVGGGDFARWQICRKTGNISGSYVTIINIDLEVGGTAFAQQRYIQASPPYKIGDTAWGHFLFVLRNISSGLIVSAYEAEDPPWAYNGPPFAAKDSIERIQAVPHPFADYIEKYPAVDGLEIVLVDLSGYDVKKWKTDNAKMGKSILEDLAGNVNPGQLRAHTDFGLPEIAGFTDKVKIRARI